MPDPTTPLEVPRDGFATFEAAVEREWLATNGLGGYAFGTVAGPATRSYHGLLVAALEPPVARTVLVGGLSAWVTIDGQRLALHTHERDAGLDGDGWRRLVDVRLDGSRPVLTYDLGGARVARTVWMAHDANTTYVRFELLAGPAEVALELEPLTTDRNHHDLTGAADGVPGGPLRILAPGAAWTPGGRWERGFVHREETSRGQPDRSDLWVPGAVHATLAIGRPVTLILTAEPDEPADPDAALAASIARDADLLELAGAGASAGAGAGASAGAGPGPSADRSRFVERLVLAADQFIVRRDIPTADGGVERGRTILAGYPWFNDWGRDTMIALPGLCLATGRAAEAATILRSFARFVRDGLVPNDFPEHSDVSPAYHTIDGSLWFPMAVRAHALATGDATLVDELLPTLRSIVEAHLAGTRFGIGVDPADGLVRGGADGVQLTWMDARLDDWVVTPRRGKPVEIQALWVNALRTIGGWLIERGDADGDGARYLALAERATASFVARFWRSDLGYLLDVVDGPEGDDPSLRPNQLFAISLPWPLLDGDRARQVVERVARDLAAPLGLRSLAPSDPAYRARYQGDRRFRDGAYHQGTAWAWPMGAYAEATARVSGDPAAGRALLEAFIAHLTDAGLGSISEILEPEPPYAPRGCPFQAWSVAEVLRVWLALGGR